VSPNQVYSNATGTIGKDRDGNYINASATLNVDLSYMTVKLFSNDALNIFNN
jgi:hypothetical protein